MTAHLRALLRFDLAAVDPGKGLLGLSSVLAFAVFVALFGSVGMVAALATVFIILSDQPGPLRTRAVTVVAMTAAGSLIGLIGAWAGTEHIAVAVALTFVVVTAATLAAAYGLDYALRGMLLAVWAVLAVSLAGQAETATELALAFAGGGLVAAAAIWLRARGDTEPPVVQEAKLVARNIEGVVRSPLGWFALMRGTAAATALWMGIVLFPDHPVWASLTVIVVMKPRPGETTLVGLLRTAGTLVGVLIAEMIILVGGDQTTVLLVGFLLAAFGMAALQRVNYAVFVACLTAMLVLADELALGTGEATAGDRLLATLLGAALALFGIALGRLVLGLPLITTAGASPTAVTDDTPG